MQACVGLSKLKLDLAKVPAQSAYRTQSGEAWTTQILASFAEYGKCMQLLMLSLMTLARVQKMSMHVGFGAMFAYKHTVDRQAALASLRPPAPMASRGANKLIKLGWIGAGGINFGSLEGPWNHAVRMQKQNNVQFTAVVDPNLSAAQVCC